MTTDPGQATILLQRMEGGDSAASEQLLSLLYKELRRVADRLMGREREAHTLQPTALVHEAWLRLIPGSQATPNYSDRQHFVSVAATAMRHVLVDHARARDAQKRGDGGTPVSLDGVIASFEERSLNVVALDEALERLTAKDPELGRIVELRFFAGLTIAETAKVVGVSTPTVERRWRVARMWLRSELPESGE